MRALVAAVFVSFALVGCSSPEIYRDRSVPITQIDDIALVVLADPNTVNLHRNGILLQSIADEALRNLRSESLAPITAAIGLSDRAVISAEEMRQLRENGFTHILKAVIFPREESTYLRKTDDGAELSHDVDQQVMCSFYDAATGREISNTQSNAYRGVKIGGLAGLLIPKKPPNERFGDSVYHACANLLRAPASIDKL
jgi:hypothetical protein